MDTNEKFIEELLHKTDLVRLVSEYVKLNKKGNTHWACCPFHHEKTPSFSVDEKKQLYYCFGSCKEGGNAISFIKKIESASGADAVRILAKKAGLEVPSFAGGKKKESLEDINKKTRLFGLTKLAAKYYNDNLLSKNGEMAKKYLYSRNIGDNLIARFGIGYSSCDTGLLEELKKNGYTELEAKEAGLASPFSDSYKDPFSKRLIIPIIDQFGEVCAFGGRLLESNADFAKYKNSANNILFEKNKVVFGGNLIQRLKRKQNIKSIILCEGYMDVIALHAAGFENCVACMGTALSYNQAKIIRNFAPKVYISFDGDTAGRKNALSSIDTLAFCNLLVRVVVLPRGKDPDDVVSEGGASAYQGLLDNALTATAFRIECAKEKYNLLDLEEKASFTKEAIRAIKQLDSPVEEEEYYKEISSLTGYAIEVLKRQADKQQQVIPPEAVVEQPKQDYHSLYKESRSKIVVLAALAAEKSFVCKTEDFSFLLNDEFLQEVAKFFILKTKKGTDSVASLYLNKSEKEAQVLDSIINYQYTGSLQEQEKEYFDCISHLKIENLIAKKKSLEKRCSGADIASLKVLLKKIKDIDLEILEIKNRKK